MDVLEIQVFARHASFLQVPSVMSTGEEEKADRSGSNTSTAQQAEVFERPEGWRGIHYHPITQVCLVGFVCFMCPGIFNALSGLGAGGQVYATTSPNAIATHYAFFAFFAGFVHNVLGSRLCLFLGTCGYPLYIASYIATNIHPGAADFVVVAGAVSGVCASLIWTAEGSLMMAYPTEAQKGIFIGYFWAIFNLGAVVGSAVAFGTNFHSTVNHLCYTSI